LDDRCDGLEGEGDLEECFSSTWCEDLEDRLDGFSVAGGDLITGDDTGGGISAGSFILVGGDLIGGGGWEGDFSLEGGDSITGVGTLTVGVGTCFVEVVSE